ncbi:MAG: hypothetical protein ACFFKA_14115 [Candidatus Thorarchaeota archaeon]
MVSKIQTVDGSMRDVRVYTETGSIKNQWQKVKRSSKKINN